MRHDAPATGSSTFAVGDLVVVAGRVGVWRVERFVDAGVRCFSYVDGAIVVVSVDDVAVVPDNQPADKNL